MYEGKGNEKMVKKTAVKPLKLVSISGIMEVLEVQKKQISLLMLVENV